MYKQHEDVFEDEIDLKEIFTYLWKDKYLIFLITLAFSISSVLYSLSLPNIYTSQAILVPVSNDNGVSSSMQNMSGLARMAGININTSSSINKSDEAIKKMTSLSFFSENIINNIFLPDLVAVKSWNPENNTIIYDEKIYDTNKKTWAKNDDNKNFSMEPSIQQAYKKFTKLMTVIKDKDTGFIYLSIEHESPFIAKSWNKNIIDKINMTYRNDAKISSSLSMEYLNDLISKTNLVETKYALAELIQNEVQKLSLVEANQDYIFKELDPPYVPDMKSKPQRAIICILGLIFGLMIGIFITLLKYFIFDPNSSFHTKPNPNH